MIPVFHGGHLFSCPLWTVVVVVMYIRIDVFFKFFKCFAAGCVDLILQMSEEGFGWSVVEAVSSSRHGLDASEFSELLGVARMRVLESLIGLYDRSGESVFENISFELFERTADETEIRTERKMMREYLSA